MILTIKKRLQSCIRVSEKKMARKMNLEILLTSVKTQ